MVEMVARMTAGDAFILVVLLAWLAGSVWAMHRERLPYE